MTREQQALKDRADARFAIRREQKEDAPKAMAEYLAAQQAIRDRTQLLRKERLARQAQIIALAAPRTLKKKSR